MNKPLLMTVLVFFVSPIAQAQTTIQIGKITCDQYNLFKVTDPQKIAIWLSGYYHGIQKDTTLEIDQLEQRAEKLKDYCYDNPKAHVMDAVEKVFRHRDAK
jgi:acid stress chaperone HdeB